MYLGRALSMKPRFHDLRAFLDTNAALEVRDMIPTGFGCESIFSVNETFNEVSVC